MRGNRVLVEVELLLLDLMVFGSVYFSASVISFFFTDE